VPGSLKLLMAHYHQSSACSESSRSNQSSVLSQGPIYDEIVAPSGFRVGELKCVVVRKVFQSEIVTVSVLI